MKNYDLAKIAASGRNRRYANSCENRPIAFHEYILGKAQEIRFVKGRLKFEIDRKANKEAAPFPSMIVIFRGSSTTKTNVETYIQEKEQK